MEQQQPLSIHLTSFGYRNGGAPKDQDHLANLTHVPCPNRHLTRIYSGVDARFQKELWRVRGVSDAYDTVITQLVDFVENALNVVPVRDQENSVQAQPHSRVFLFGVGCERGMHRSVAFVLRLRNELSEAIRDRLNVPTRSLDINVDVSHRDLATRLSKLAGRSNEIEEDAERAAGKQASSTRQSNDVTMAPSQRREPPRGRSKRKPIRDQKRHCALIALHADND